MSTRTSGLEDFVCREVESLCDADPKVLAQYIIALIGTGECNDQLRASLEDKLKEFFEDQTAPFIDRLFRKLNSSNNYGRSRESSDRFNAYSDEEDDDGDRNFKHSRPRSDHRTDYAEHNKRRYQNDSQQQNNKYFRFNNGDDRRNHTSQFYDRGRGSRGRGGYTGINRPFSKPPMCRDYIEKGFCLRGDVCPYDHGRDRIIVEDSKPGHGTAALTANPTKGAPNQPFATGANDAYDPERASLLPTNGFSNEMRGGRRGGRGGRGGGRGGFRNYNNNPTNTTLTVEKIPAEMCQIATVNGYFAKFGTIVNISVHPHLQKATIQYSNRMEAEKAHTCPDAIFDNRFIKVYWNKDEAASTAPAPEEHPASPKPVSNEPDPELVAARAAEFAKLREEKHKKHKEKMLNILEAQKKKELELQEKITEHKRLFEKFSDSTSAEEKVELMKQIKSVQSDIDNSQKPKTQEALAVSSIDSKEQLSTELQKKLEQLEAEAAALGVNTNDPYTSRGGFMGRGRGSWPRARGGHIRMSLDNRPTKVIIKEIPQDVQEDELRKHFEQYGTVSSFEKTELEASVQYAQRFMAEKAMCYGQNFPKGKLQLSWPSNNLAETSTQVA